MAAALITLITDFGTSDPYVGVMKGVVLGINPNVTIVDISHDIQPQSISEAAFVLGTSHHFFPEGTIHVVVVDPGVGTARRVVLLTTPRASYLAPDNGVLSQVLQDSRSKQPNLAECNVALPSACRAYHITNADYWVNPVSSTFHGRDIFAPVAAHLTLGVPPQTLGQKTEQLTQLPIEQPQRHGETIWGRVVHVDRFGNLITDIPSAEFLLQEHITVGIGGHHISGLSSSYQDGNGLLAIIGSHGNLEVSAKNSNAAHILGTGVGEPVRVDLAPEPRSS